MTKKPFVIYKSSAGSGKTYTLAKNYIRLSLKSKNYFKKILAVTFTNKASEEMKLRILEMINSISIGEEKNLVIEFSNHYKISPEEIIIRAKNLKSNILHNYSFFMVTTIDAFFYSIIQSFTRELKFRGKFNIEMEMDQVIEDVVINFISEIKSGSDLSKWLIDFSKEKINKGKDFMIQSELKKMTKNLFDEEFKALEEKLPKKGLSNLVKKIKNEVFDVKNKYEKKISNQASIIYDTVMKYDYTVDDFSFGKSGVMGFIKNISENNFKYPGKRIFICNENIQSWVNKKNKNRDELILFIESKLMFKFNMLIDNIEKEFPKYNASIEISNNIYSFGILIQLQNQVRKYRDDNEVILISDISELLFQIIKDENIPFVFEKVGTNINHFLIDEFQDTSSFQWKNFCFMIKESLASGNENVVVGDIKQSIYRWRGSDSQILNSKIFDDIPPEICDINKLQVNWRSGQNIVDFNNKVFEDLYSLFDNDKISNHLKKVYNSDLLQKSRHEMVGKGSIEVVFGDDEDHKVASAEYTIKTIKLIQDKGYSAGDIGVIVRDNNDAKIIANALINESKSDKNYNFNHVSADALDIKSSPIVIFLISIFNYFKNFKDRLALSEILHFYYRYIIESNKNDHYSLSNEEKKNLLPENFTKNLFKISRLPLYEMVEEIIRIFRLNILHNQRPYLQAFLDILLEYKQSKGSQLSSFLDWWNVNNNKKLNLSSQNNAIQLITIHKSKGLEFNHVIIPFLDWSLDNESGGGREKNIWVNMKKFNKNFDIPFPLKYKSSLPISIFSDYYEIEKLKAFEDNINLMYVSFTRPKLGLFIRGTNTTNKLKNVSDLLYMSIKNNLKEGIYKVGSLLEKKHLSKSKPYYVNTFPSHSWKDRVKVKLSSSSGTDFKNMERGEMIHKVVSLISNYNHIENGINKAIKRNFIEQKDKILFSKKINQILNNKKLKIYYDPKYNSYNEREIISNSGEIYRLDRVVEIEENSAVVIDYKTGKEEVSNKTQIENYKELLCKIYSGKIYGFIVYIDLNKIVEI